MENIKINGAKQINIFGETQEESSTAKTKAENELHTKANEEKDGVMYNDAGEEISVENGYAPADIEEIEEEKEM